MSAQENRALPNGTAPTVRQHCQRILKELEELYAQGPRMSLRQSIEQVKALLARLPKDQPPRQ